jgi:DNA mismatch repair ATPase MutL
MTILSRQKGEKGYKMREEGEELVVELMENIEVGTMVIVEEIFKHTPVRKQDLVINLSQYYSHIILLL